MARLNGSDAETLVSLWLMPLAAAARRVAAAGLRGDLGIDRLLAVPVRDSWLMRVVRGEASADWTRASASGCLLLCCLGKQAKLRWSSSSSPLSSDADPRCPRGDPTCRKGDPSGILAVGLLLVLLMAGAAKLRLGCCST